MADIQTIRDVIGLPDHMKIIRVDRDNPLNTHQTFTVLVNPASYIVEYGAVYFRDQAIGSSESEYHFNRTTDQKISLELLFDSTGSLGKMPLIGNHNVLDQVEQFLEVAYINYSPKEEEGLEKRHKVMRLIWGPMEFWGYLTKVSISYTHFDATGVPVRAKASCEFTGGNINFEKAEKMKNPFRKKGKPRKVININKQKHAINAVVKYGSYMSILALQPKSGMPKSLRIAEQILKMII